VPNPRAALRIPTVITAGIAAVACLVRPGGAQALRGGVSVSSASALGTMATYFEHSLGFGITVRRDGGGLVNLRGDAEFLDFSEVTLSRLYNGAGPSLLITSGAAIVLLTGGAELRRALGRVETALSAGVGAAYIHFTGAVDSLGTSAQNRRSGTFTTLTWQAQAGAAVALRLSRSPAAPRIELSARLVQAGTTDLLREYNLPVGVISGLYANPTPFAPTFAIMALGMTARL
jgi:hypothetical protein